MDKKNIFQLLVTMILATGIGFIIFTNHDKKDKKEEKRMEEFKTLIVYYSRTGNTKVVAELIQEKVGGTLVKIETKELRPKDYRTEVEQNEKEQDNHTLPELKTIVSDFDEYNRIFIGTPTWNMAVPQAVLSFLESYNFDGKTVIPFNTHGGYGEGSTFRQISANISGANILSGYTVKGGEETNGVLLAIKDKNKDKVSKEIDLWLEDINQLNE